MLNSHPASMNHTVAASHGGRVSDAFAKIYRPAASREVNRWQKMAAFERAARALSLPT
jgi:hypothetical protein